MKRPEQREVEALVVALILAGRDGMKLGESTGISSWAFRIAFMAKTNVRFKFTHANQLG